MRSRFKKIIYWSSGLLVYALMVMTFCSQLLGWNPGRLLPVLSEPESVLTEAVSSGPAGLLAASAHSGLLLPLGPQDCRLPGYPEIWAEIMRAGTRDERLTDRDGFDGLQAVSDIADYSRDALATLFLNAPPVQAFRRGNNLLVLNGRGSVQLIDCANPGKPVIRGVLDYRSVRQMEMRGDKAFLLLANSTRQNDVYMVVVDLHDLGQPRQIASFRLPQLSRSFFLLDGQLVVYASSRGVGASHDVYSYDLTDDYRPMPIGRAESPNLGSGFLQYDGLLLIADLHAGVHLYDFNNPLQPFHVVSLGFSDRVTGMVRHGQLVFAQGAQNRIYVIDLHDRTRPILKAVMERANFPAYFLELADYTYFFTSEGYLAVFDTNPLDLPASYAGHADWVATEPVVWPEDAGFTLLGSDKGPLPAGVDAGLPLPSGTRVVDSLFWNACQVVLDERGRLYCYDEGRETPTAQPDVLSLPNSQGWLAASAERLYVGAGAVVQVLARGDDGRFVVTGRIDLEGRSSSDGLVANGVLWLAAGRDGLLGYSLADPDRPTAAVTWHGLRNLAGQIDIRQLSSPGDDRLLLAAGAAGLLIGQTTGGRFELTGALAFRSPVRALATMAGICLVSTGDKVAAVDVRSKDYVQSLGLIAFPGVTRFAVARDFWAGFVPDSGWLILPAPRILTANECDGLRAVAGRISPERRIFRYRLTLFNDREVLKVPGVLAVDSDHAIWNGSGI